MFNLRAAIERQWYGKPGALLLLIPLVPLFILISLIRRYWLCANAQPLAVPVIVVGNITVGGTGKTPVIIALVRSLTALGFKPGVITRGYGASLVASRLLDEDASAVEFGDEPVLVAQSASCPVAVGPSRVESARLLIRQCGVNVILSDDGLQHYRLHRDIEIAVIDGARQLGNGWRLPVGPLREGRQRLSQVDFVLVNGSDVGPHASAIKAFHFLLHPICWRNVLTNQCLSLTELPIKDAVAIAGIGNPQRFFDTLAALGFRGACHRFADHHAYQASDLRGFGSTVILMTEKDAVKCREFAEPNWWALCVEAQLPDLFLKNLGQALIQSN